MYARFLVAKTVITEVPCLIYKALRGVSAKEVCKTETVLNDWDAADSEGQGVGGVVVVARVVMAVLEEAKR